MATFKIRDKRDRERFSVDDAYINGMAKYVGPHATAVYLSLCRHSNFENQSSFPSQELIAKQHGISVRTVINKMAVLKSFNVIQIKRVRDKNGRFRHNVCYLMDKSVWKYPCERDADGRPCANNNINHVQEIHPNVTHNKVTHILSSEDNTQSVVKAVVKKENPSSAKTTYGNQDINKLLSYIKEKMDLPILNGSIKDNRFYAYTALRKFGGLEKCKLIVDAAADDEWWRYRLTSARDLFYNGIRIISASRDQKKRALTLKRNEKGEVVGVE